MIKSLLFFALKGDVPVGFKAGYAITKNRYYSWLGGVHPDFHRNGIASLLMKEQHDWIRNSEYTIVETHVRQGNTAMIELNLKFGFAVTGNFTRSGDPNFIMQLPVKS
ncbi:MAG: GNAT family N-acetyltransferase [Gammaproteobacteria bacterium]|nr:GNAT family N-acetyltransferase [Gammaproteobacteria bacterium]